MSGHGTRFLQGDLWWTFTLLYVSGKASHLYPFERHGRVSVWMDAGIKVDAMISKKVDFCLMAC